MNSKKSLFAAVSVAALSLLSIGSASAAPWHQPQIRSHHGPVMNHRFVDRDDLRRVLRVHQYRMIAAPEFRRGQYVVRAHDRFGRVVLVRLDPYSGRFLGAIRL